MSYTINTFPSRNSGSMTVHNIVVDIDKSINLRPVMDKIITNLKTNLTGNHEEFIEVITKMTEYIAKLETKRFAFKGDLERGIAHRIFKKAKRGEVFIKSDQVQKAIMNEFGVTSPENHRGMPYARKMTSRLKEWARKKAPQWADKSFIIVGKPNTGSHVIAPNPQNRFWE